MTALHLPAGITIAGKYTLRTLLGYGGATASYDAVVAGRSVVIKLFSPQLADRADVLSALQHAAAVTNALPAEATAPILDVGFDPQTRSPYMVTESMPLPSLLAVVRTGPLAPLDVAAILRGMALAVDAAHAHGLTHGGLKPQNVFTGEGPQRPVRVIDFGVHAARVVLPTEEGRGFAAPWLAPEQLHGSGPAGPSADVFSAALVAFFASTGCRYWRSCQKRAPDLAALAQEMAGARPLASAWAREFGVGLPSSWDPVFARALAHDPAQRFGSVAELASAFASASAHLPPVGSEAAALGVAHAQPSSAPVGTEDGRPPPSRTGLVIALAIVALLMAAGLTVFVLSKRWPAPTQAALVSPTPPASTAPAASTVPSAEPSERPSTSESASTDAQVAPAPSSSAAPVPETAQLTVVCVPDCDTLTVDDHVLDAGLADPLELTSGTHTVVAARATFIPQTRKVTLKSGQTQKASFILLKPGPPPPKPCGKFLERCP